MLRHLFIAFSLVGLLSSCQSYKKIHKDAVLIDTHNDVLSSVTMKGMSIEDDLAGKAQSDIARFKKGGVDIQGVFPFFAMSNLERDLHSNLPTLN